ncbi:GAF domain-containing protein [Flavobacterium wongokense]|uniref:GAF domain-containing protein n=1 Tax=Flavobacterium wongokense TaxID=2910674 RepID=UPI001F333AF2|nr:GAF domain-containing protein [Flavobacterium sp. WG47]MCF6133376.1 GAF domain-containing protein [Flavobacterium sp. WG47]
MKSNLEQTETPFIAQISFHKLIETLEQIAASNVDYRVNYAMALLKEVERLPEFRTGIVDLSVINEHEELIRNLLADLFPTALTHNEIKAVAIPFHNVTFNYTQRFKNILKDAGVAFDMNIRDFDDERFYIMSCCLILNAHYKQNIEFNNPLFYDIPDGSGIMKHYRILYNADFIEIIPTEKAIPLTEEDIVLLIDNYDDFELWKEKFPLKSWILKGFGIVQLFDTTTESSVSTLKTNLLKATDTKNEELAEDFQSIFRSIFRIPDLRIGLTIYEPEDKKFIRPNVDARNIHSFILSECEEAECSGKLYNSFFDAVIKEKQIFIVSDVDIFSAKKGNEALGSHLKQQNIKSCILAPVIKGDEILGIFELASEKTRVLNSINANKLELILPYLTDTLSRYRLDLQNQIEAVIQKEYTAIHSSVYWKFRREAQKYIRTLIANQSKDYIFKEIVFKEVYPLFGQIDVKGSSEHRNESVVQDLRIQLETLIAIIESMESQANLMILQQRKFELHSFLTQLDAPLKADTEQIIQRYVESEIHPIIHSNADIEQSKDAIEKYFKKIDEKTGMFYHARKKFDNALSKVNKRLATVLDEKQLEAQKIFPHYYERFKTDGVEHNLYIGASIAPEKSFDKIYLNNLRLWQLQTLCEMELEHHELKGSLPYTLDVTSLILVFSSPISIRFRMDEKRFDVDGTYNARYEVVKKRIDKAFIKGTRERITEKEKITIIYSHSHEEREYMDYIKYLQFKEILEPKVEQFEVEELQGVSGLKGIRVKVVHQKH